MSGELLCDHGKGNKPRCRECLLEDLRVEKEAHAKTAKQFVDMKSYADGLELKYKDFRTRADVLAEEADAIRAERTEALVKWGTAESALEAVKVELQYVLNDWNALTKAIGSPTNGTAVAHAARLSAAAKEVEALRVYASALETENAALHAILDKARGVSSCCLCGADYDRGFGHDDDCLVGKWDRGER